MKISQKISFLIKFAGSMLTSFAVMMLAAKFFILPHVPDSTVAMRFYVTSFTAFFIALIITTYLIWAYVFDPAESIKKDLEKMLTGDIATELDMHGHGALHDVNEELKRVKVKLKVKIDNLQYARSYLETVFLKMSDGVMVLDGEGNILLLNEALKDVLKVSDVGKGKRPIEVVRNSEIQSITDQVLSGPANTLKKEISVLLPEQKSFLVSATPIIKKGRNQAAVLVFHETTLLKQYEQMRKDFVANVSHELRTPISNIKGYVETLLDGAMHEEAVVSEFLQIIRSESDRLVSLVKDLLDISMIESGKVHPEPESCDIRGLVQAVLIRVRSSAEEKNITLLNKVPHDARPVLADRDMLYQVFFNILDNAVKYVQSGGEVIVTAFSDGDLLRVDVTDNGPGIPDEDKERVFERFYRLDKARSRELGGTGLGLSIVKHIVQEHGGQVWVRNAPSRGSVFSFTLPAV